MCNPAKPRNDGNIGDGSVISCAHKNHRKSRQKLMFQTLVLSLLLLGSLAHAEEETPVIIADQPDLPAPIKSGETMDPDVTIIRRGEETIEEYRINNQLYMVKITPVIGPAYVLVDTNGDGNLEVRHSDNERGMNINKWVLFSW